MALKTNAEFLRSLHSSFVFSPFTVDWMSLLVEIELFFLKPMLQPSDRKEERKGSLTLNSNFVINTRARGLFCETRDGPHLEEQLGWERIR